MLLSYEVNSERSGIVRGREFAVLCCEDWGMEGGYGGLVYARG